MEDDYPSALQALRWLDLAVQLSGGKTMLVFGAVLVAGAGERHTCVPAIDPALTAGDNDLMTEVDGRALLPMAGIVVVVPLRIDNYVLRGGCPKNVTGYILSPLRM